MLGALATTAVSQTPSYQVTDLGTLGGFSSIAWDISDAGLVVGQATTNDHDAVMGFSFDGALSELDPFPGGQAIAFGVNEGGHAVGVQFHLGDVGGVAAIWHNGTTTQLGAFEARGINDANFVVGMQLDTLGGVTPVTWQAGMMNNLPTLTGGKGAARAVNNEGLIVGGSTNAAGANRATAWVAGNPIDMGTLGGQRSDAYDTEDGGWVVGSADLANGSPHAFRARMVGSSVTGFTDLGTVEGGTSQAYGVNAAGDVVGTSDWNAFLWRDGMMHNLNQLIVTQGWELTHAMAINSAGEIVGRGRHDGELRAFLLTEVTCEGDLNGDNMVDLSDLASLLAHFGTSGVSRADGDLDGNGTVDLADLAALLAHFGEVCN
ncbi:MAG: hypothetical protein KDA32_05855 [Phycisphaerales bacterium]|nr:hypothetical protein [Phycisphaerales bacterium]